MTISDRDFQQLVHYMQEKFGINLTKKRTLVEGRLGNHIIQEGYEGFHDYLADVYKDASGDKIDALVTRLTTNYTYFMREEAHYQFMTRTALPEWTQKLREYDLRTWSAGCSSGEEAYTTAMVISEYLGPAKSRWDVTVLATDISPRVLDIAKTGVYPAESLEKLPASWKTKYFTPAGPDAYKVGPALAGEVVFGTFNLMGNFSRFKQKFHIIFCRNVMIYFDAPTKRTLAQKFYDALEPGGYFFIGMSETLQGVSSQFTQISPAIYRKGS